MHLYYYFLENIMLCFICIILLSGFQAADVSTTTTTTTETVTSTAATLNSDNAEERYKYLTADGVPTCESKVGNIGDCLEKIFSIMVPRFRDGNAALGIPQLDPFIINRTTFQFTNGPLRGSFTIKKALAYGFADMVHTKFDFEIDKKGKTKARTAEYVPKAHVIGTYKGDFSVNNAHLKPKGTFNLTLVDINLDLSSKGELYEKNGHRFLKLNEFHAEPRVNDFIFNATGIFPDPSLNEIVLNVLNSSWRELFRAILPETRRYWAPMLMDVMNNVFSIAPLDNFIKDV